MSAELFIHANIICKFYVHPYYNIRLSEHLLASGVITQGNSIKAIFINAWEFRLTEEVVSWVNQFESNNEGTILFYQGDRFFRLNRAGEGIEIIEVQHEEILSLFETNLSREDFYVYDICDNALGMIHDFEEKILEMKYKSSDSIQYLRDNLYIQRLVMKGTKEFHCNYSWKQTIQNDEFKSGNFGSIQGDFGMNFSVDFIPLKEHQVREQPHFPLLTIKLTANGNWTEVDKEEGNSTLVNLDIMTLNFCFANARDWREVFKGNEDRLQVVLKEISKRIEKKGLTIGNARPFALQLD